jgi:hypothetical protein
MREAGLVAGMEQEMDAYEIWWQTQEGTVH